MEKKRKGWEKGMEKAEIAKGVKKPGFPGYSLALIKQAFMVSPLLV